MNPLASDEEVTRAAAEWVARSDRGLSYLEQLEFSRWQAADPRHAAEFGRIRSTWRKLDAIECAPALTAIADEVVTQARARRKARRLVRLTAWTSAAAAALILGVVGWTRFRDAPATIRPKENYRVLASTVQRTLLPDGSMAELNGDSRIEITFTSTARRVRLLSGEAHFVVAKNPERPFFVTAGPVTVRAVGTAFNVRLAAEKIEVLVTEGKVKLEHAPAASPVQVNATQSAPALLEGQKAVIQREPIDAQAARVAVAEVNKSEIETELGWQSTRLVFNNTPLDEVIEGFNRYNTHRLTLGDPALKDRALTGIFRADNREGFVRLLRASVDVKAEQRTPHETVLLPIR